MYKLLIIILLVYIMALAPFLIPVIFVVFSYYKEVVFKKTSYYKITKYSLKSTLNDPGRHGEYLIYKYLRSYEDFGGKFLFNCYVPKDNGGTIEVDVLLINEDGIFCFESKNYSGWIFGDEKAKNWAQTFPRGRGRSHKNYFLNPIIQNNTHIKWLKKKIDTRIPIHSVIVFSDRCILKKLIIESVDVQVINTHRLVSTVKEIGNNQIEKLTSEVINELYDLLYPYTQVTESVRLQHVEDIKNKFKG